MATDSNLGKIYTVGLNNVGSYQVAGHPFITGSTNLDNNKCHMIEFPYVSKSLTVINNNVTGDDIRVHFQSGSGVTAFTVPGDNGAQTIADTSDVIAQLNFLSVTSREVDYVGYPWG